MNVKRQLFVFVMSMMLIGILGNSVLWAGSKDLEATKRKKFQDNQTQSMRDVVTRKDNEEKEYREKSLKLLEEIRDLLVKLNKKED